MPYEWLTPEQAAEILNCSTKTVLCMLCDGIIPGESPQGQWRAEADAVKRLREISESTAQPPAFPRPSSAVTVDPGMIEVSLALAGIGTAVTTFTFQQPTIPEALGLLTVMVMNSVVILSTYCALWLLASYSLRERRIEAGATGFREIFDFLSHPTTGPYWMLAQALLGWMVASIILLAALVVGE